jgi:hypothetical protein
MSVYWDHHVGLDLGQSSDFSALAIVEEPLWVHDDWSHKLNIPASGWVPLDGLTEWQIGQARSMAHHYGRPATPPLHLRHVQRWPLKTAYPRIVDDVVALLSRPPLRDRSVALCVDATGVGRAVIDQLNQRGQRPISITISPGLQVHYGPWSFSVPKRDLIMAAVYAFQSSRLKIAADLPLAQTLKSELEAFRIKVNAKGHDSYEAWHESDHDDLVLAVAMAIWHRDDRNLLIDQQEADLGTCVS